jgi:hypothetical protein
MNLRPKSMLYLPVQKGYQWDCRGIPRHKPGKARHKPGRARKGQEGGLTRETTEPGTNQEGPREPKTRLGTYVPAHQKGPMITHPKETYGPGATGGWGGTLGPGTYVTMGLNKRPLHNPMYNKDLGNQCGKS